MQPDSHFAPWHSAATAALHVVPSEPVALPQVPTSRHSATFATPQMFPMGAEQLPPAPQHKQIVMQPQAPPLSEPPLHAGIGLLPPAGFLPSSLGTCAQACAGQPPLVQSWGSSSSIHPTQGPWPPLAPPHMNWLSGMSSSSSGTFPFTAMDIAAPVGLAPPAPLVAPRLSGFLGAPETSMGHLDSTGLPLGSTCGGTSPSLPWFPSYMHQDAVFAHSRELRGLGEFPHLDPGSFMVKGPETDWACSSTGMAADQAMSTTTSRPASPPYPGILAHLPRMHQEHSRCCDAREGIRGDQLVAGAQGEACMVYQPQGGELRFLGTRALLLAEEWVRDHVPMPVGATLRASYPRGAIVDLSELSSNLKSAAAASSSMQRARAAQALDGREHAGRLLDAYCRADKERTGMLTWGNGEIRDFVATVFQQRGLAPPTETQMYAVYTIFDKDRAMRLEARECLCLADALLRATLLAGDDPPPGTGSSAEQDASGAGNAEVHAAEQAMAIGGAVGSEDIEENVGDLEALGEETSLQPRGAYDAGRSRDALAEARAETERLRRELEELRELEALAYTESSSLAATPVAPSIAAGTAWATIPAPASPAVAAFCTGSATSSARQIQGRGICTAHSLHAPPQRHAAPAAVVDGARFAVEPLTVTEWTQNESVASGSTQTMNFSPEPGHFQVEPPAARAMTHSFDEAAHSAALEFMAPRESPDTATLVRTAKAHAENSRLEKELRTLRAVASGQRLEAQWLHDVKTELAAAAREREAREALQRRHQALEQRELEFEQLERENEREHQRVLEMRAEALKRREIEVEQLEKEGKREREQILERERALRLREEWLEAQHEATLRQRQELEQREVEFEVQARDAAVSAPSHYEHSPPRTPEEAQWSGHGDLRHTPEEELEPWSQRRGSRRAQTPEEEPWSSREGNSRRADDEPWMSAASAAQHAREAAEAWAPQQGRVPAGATDSNAFWEHRGGHDAAVQRSSGSNSGRRVAAAGRLPPDSGNAAGRVRSRSLEAAPARRSPPGPRPGRGLETRTDGPGARRCASRCQDGSAGRIPREPEADLDAEPGAIAAAAAALENKRLKRELEGLRTLAHWQKGEAMAYSSASGAVGVRALPASAVSPGASPAGDEGRRRRGSRGAAGPVAAGGAEEDSTVSFPANFSSLSGLSSRLNLGSIGGGGLGGAVSAGAGIAALGAVRRRQQQQLRLKEGIDEYDRTVNTLMARVTSRPDYYSSLLPSSEELRHHQQEVGLAAKPGAAPVAVGVEDLRRRRGSMGSSLMA